MFDRVPPQEEHERGVTKNVYESSLGPVEILSKEFLPRALDESDAQDRFAKNKAIIFVVGYGLQAGDTSVAELAQHFADYGHVATYSLSTRLEDLSYHENTIEAQAEAIKKFVEEKGLDEVTIAGHSEGGDKSIDLAALLQDSSVSVDGLILMESMGLYNQDPAELLKNFFVDSLNTVKESTHHAIETRDLTFAKESTISGFDIMMAAAREIQNHGAPLLWKRMQRDLASMATLNVNAEKISVPIVLVQGREDEVSQLKNIIPDEESLQHDRENYLKEHLFKKAPYVRMITGGLDLENDAVNADYPPKKDLHGMPLFRSEAVAKTALYMLQRAKRG